MMPPKKSKAAREHQEKAADDIKENGASTKAAAAAADVPVVNIFKEPLVEGKRQRTAPASELKLTQWLDEHFETKEGKQLLKSDMYDCYVNFCVASGAFAQEQPGFMKAVKQHFPDGMALKEESPYIALVKVVKEKKKREKSSVCAPSLKIKMRDMIDGVMKDAGNPRKGLRFVNLKMLIASKFPALHIDGRPGMLKRSLEHGVRWGHVENVKGVGMAGYYRVPGPADDDGKEDEKKKKKTEAKKVKKDGEEGEAGDSEDKTDEEEDGDEAKAEAGDGDVKEEDAKKDAKKPKKAKKKVKKSKPTRHDIQHSDPKRIEDSFELAMTFMMEPKEASITKVRKYIEEHYRDNLKPDNLKKCLEAGEEKGFWERVTGIGGSGSFRLLIDEFDPTDDGDLTGQVVNAITACTEPKEASARALKQYLIEFHPDFKVAERPNLFKRALERAIKRDIIRQLSGIGATGTFMLAHPFVPSPVILAGKDTESDYDQSSGEESVIDESAPPDLSLYQDAYVPRPSKRRGQSRKAAAGIERFIPAQESPSKKKSVKKRAHGGSKKSRHAEESSSDEDSSSSSSSEDEDEDEEPVPQKKFKRGKPSARNQRVKRLDYAEDSGSEYGAAPKTKKRRSPAKARGKPAARGGKGKSPAKQEPVKDEPESGSDSEAEESSPPAKKGGGTPAKQGKSTPAKATPAAKGKASPAKKGKKRGRRN